MPPSEEWPCKIECNESLKDRWRSSSWAAFMPARVCKSCVCRLLDLLVVWTQPLYPDWGHCVRWNGEWFEWLRGWGWYRLNILLFLSSSLCVVQAVWLVSAKVLKRVAWIEPYGSNFFTHALLWWARAVAVLVSTHFNFYMLIRSSATYIMHKCKAEVCGIVKSA